MRLQNKKRKQALHVGTESYFILDLRLVKANTFQRMDSDIIPTLYSAGYGLFEKQKGHDDKMPLWALLTSNKLESQSLAICLIDQFEPKIKELGDWFVVGTQLHNVGVVPNDEQTSGNGYNVVFGMRRCLAAAYNHARSFGAYPLTIKAEIVTPFFPHGSPKRRSSIPSWLSLNDSTARHIRH